MVHNIWKIDLYEKKASAIPGEESNIVICKVCRDAKAKKHELKLSDRSLKSLIVHLKQHSNYEDKYNMLDDRTEEVASMANFLVRPSGGLSSLDKKVINLIAHQCLPFNIVEIQPFNALFNLTNSNEKIKKRQHYSEFVLPRAYQMVKSIVKSKLDKCATVSFTTDIWSSTSSSFISLTAHGIDNEWKRVKYVLAIRELPGSHRGENINAAIKGILQEWEIKDDRCYVFLRDGAANMKKAFEGEYKHADCGAHKLNTAVKTTISSSRPEEEPTEIGKCLSMCRKIAGHFSSSNLAKDRLREIQKEMKVETHRIKQDVATRWNSTLDMAERLLEQMRPIEIYFARHDPPSEAKTLTVRQWKLLKELVDLLESADASTRDLCKDDSHLGLQIGISRMLLEEVRSANVPNLLVEKNTLINKLQARFGGLVLNKNYGLALFLDPRFKDRNVNERDLYHRHLKNWLTNQFNANVEVLNVANEEAPPEEDSAEAPVFKKPRSMLARQQNINRTEVVPTPNTWTQNIDFEMISYSAEKTEPMSSDPLVYWQKNVIRFPILSKAARQYLSAPATSVASEQLFSRARVVFHYKRNSIDPFNAEQLIFLNKALENVNFTY